MYEYYYHDKSCYREGNLSVTIVLLIGIIVLTIFEAGFLCKMKSPFKGGLQAFYGTLEIGRPITLVMGLRRCVGPARACREDGDD